MANEVVAVGVGVEGDTCLVVFDEYLGYVGIVLGVYKVVCDAGCVCFLEAVAEGIVTVGGGDSAGGDDAC